MTPSERKTKEQSILKHLQAAKKGLKQLAILNTEEEIRAEVKSFIHALDWFAENKPSPIRHDDRMDDHTQGFHGRGR